MTGKTRLWQIVGPAIVVAVAFGACSNKHDELTGTPPLDPSDIPPTPTNVTAIVSTSDVTLSWEVTNGAGVTEYRVYRSEDSSSDFEYVASTGQTAYSDQQVVNGVTYWYEIAAVKGSLEGTRSLAVRAIPNVFSLVLEGGATATSGNNVVPGSRQVEYVLVAPAGTISYRVGENPDLVGNPEIGFDPANPRGTIALSAGDGVKTVYARFTGEGGVSSATVQASIMLDTRAIITSVTEDSNGAVLLVNDILHITMEVDTTGGNATVSIGDVYSDLRLYDDGTNGDLVAGDGIYELDLVITAGLEVVEAVIRGTFSDLVGNQANDVFSVTKVTIADPPSPVAFSRSSIEILGTKVTLHWSLNTDADFAAYRVFRTPGNDVGDPVTENDILVASIEDPNERMVQVTDLDGGTDYQFGVQTSDVNGFTSDLDSMTVMTAHDPAISGTILTPTLGTPGTNFTYGCTYRHAGGLAPANVRLIVDGGITYNLNQVGGGSNWVGGEAFNVTINLVSGSHTYHFEAEAVDGSTSRNPAGTNVFGGPVVTQ
jgi:hypothetical protein